MKRSRKLLILLLVLVAMIGGYFLTNQLTKTAEVAEESGTFALNEHTVEDLTALQWTADETEFNFTYADEQWSKADDEAFPTDQSVMETLANKVVALEATRKLTDVEDLSAYGLDEPSYTFTAKWSDGSETVYNMGDETPFSDGYYVSLSDDAATVYTLTAKLSTGFPTAMIDIAEEEDIPEVGDVTAMSVGTLELQYADDVWTFAGTEEAADTDKVESLLEDIKAIEWADIACVNATEDELSTYGFDEATSIRLTNVDTTALAMDISTYDDANGVYYAKLADSTMVYSVADDTVSSILSAGVDSLWNTTLVGTDVTEVTEAVFEAGDCRWAFTQTITTVEAEATEETSEETTEETSEEAETQTTVTLNGADDQNGVFNDVYGQLTALTGIERADAAQAETCLLKCTVTTENGTHEYAFYMYDVDSALAVADDGRCMLVSATNIDKLIRTLKLN